MLCDRVQEIIMLTAKPKGAFLEGLTCLSLLIGLLAPSQAAAQTFEVPVLCPEEGECVAPQDPYDPSEAPYDLSGYQTEISNSLGTHSWPRSPEITSGPTEVVDCSSLVASLRVPGRHTVVRSGITIGGCGLVNLSSNSWLELQGSATLNTGIQGGTNNRIRITGGTINSPQTAFMNGNDVLVQNVVWSNANGVAFQSGSVAHRHAYVNNTINVGVYAFILSPWDGDRRDFSIIANDILCSQTRDEACVRIQSATRTLVAANRIQNQIDNKEPVRFYAANSDSLIIDNVFEGNGISAVTMNSTGAQVGDIRNMHVIRNRMLHRGRDETGMEAFIGNPGGGTCSGIWVTDNQRITSSNANWGIGGPNNCSAITGRDNTGVDLEASPYNGTIPTCATLGCGADH